MFREMYTTLSESSFKKLCTKDESGLKLLRGSLMRFLMGLEASLPLNLTMLEHQERCTREIRYDILVGGEEI